MSNTVYIASKTKHAARWRNMRANGVRINSTWIDEAGKGESISLSDLWRNNIDQAMYCDILIAYSEPGENPKGALIEIGAALASPHVVSVLLVGFDDEQTIKHHPYVEICEDLETAFKYAGYVI